jgi:hypothetical protein
MNKRFKTSDGYTLYLVDGKWVDSKDPDRVDLTFVADEEGYPLDDTNGERLDGEFLAENDVIDAREIHPVTGEPLEWLEEWPPGAEEALTGYWIGLKAGDEMRYVRVSDQPFETPKEENEDT